MPIDPDTGAFTFDPSVDPANSNPAFQAYEAQQATYNTPGSKLVDPNNGDANAIASKLIQSQFAQWQQTFQPIELQTLQQSSLNNPNILPQAVDQAKTMANATADTMAGVNQRSISRLGIAPTEQQAGVSNRLLNLSRASAVAGSENMARGNVAATDDMIALGGIPKTTA